MVKLVHGIIGNAIKAGASDIHIEPMPEGTRVRYRIDGLLAEQMTVPLRLGPALTSRIKMLGNLDISERRLPQDGALDVRFDDMAVRLKLSLLPTADGERMVLRVMDKTSQVVAPERLGFLPGDLERIRRFLSQPSGMVLVSGPKGSGPKSTLYAFLAELNTPDTCILTVENPVEHNFPGVGQVQLKEELGLTYAAALRTFARQDPDVIMVQELRDAEVARAAMEIGSETCLVLAAVTADDASDALTRVIDLGVQPALLGATVRLVISQRGLRRVCEHCRSGYAPSKEQLHRAGLLAPSELDAVPSDLTLYRAEGCDRCQGRGYRGRLLAYEILEVSSRIREGLAAGLSREQLHQLARAEGTRTVAQNAWRLALEGRTTFEEILKLV